MSISSHKDPGTCRTLSQAATGLHHRGAVLANKPRPRPKRPVCGRQLFPPRLQRKQIDEEAVASRFQLGNAASGRFIGNAFGEPLA